MKKKIAYRLLLALAMALAAGPAGDRAAAQGAPDKSRLERARNGLPAQAAARLDQILQAAAARGLPTSVLVDKALEGEAKQAPPERILAVVAQLSENLGHARMILLDTGAPSVDEISATADALRRGVPEGALRTLAARHARQPRALAIQTLTDLVAEGVPVDHALAVLQAWADGSGDVADLRDLPAAIERLIRQGTLPSRAAEAIAQSMRGGAHGPPAGTGRRDAAPGRAGKPDRPPVAPGAGPPPGKQKAPAKTPRAGRS